MHSFACLRCAALRCRAGDYAAALDAYTRAIANGSAAGADLSVLHSNRAAAQTKLGDWGAALRDCDLGIEHDKSNIKAFVRRLAAKAVLEYPQVSLDSDITAILINRYPGGCDPWDSATYLPRLREVVGMALDVLKAGAGVSAEAMRRLEDAHQRVRSAAGGSAEQQQGARGGAAASSSAAASPQAGATGSAAGSSRAPAGSSKASFSTASAAAAAGAGCATATPAAAAAEARGQAADANADAGEQAKSCAVCGKVRGDGVKLKYCTGCRTVRYCSPECQAAHWKRLGHKQACAALRAAAEAGAVSGARSA